MSQALESEGTGRVFTEIKSPLTHLEINHVLSQSAVATCHLTLLTTVQEMLMAACGADER